MVVKSVKSKKSKTVGSKISYGMWLGYVLRHTK